MTGSLLRRVSASEVALSSRSAFDDATIRAAREIVDDVRVRREAALLEHAIRFGELPAAGRVEDLLLSRGALARQLAALPESQRSLLERVAERIRRFALAQREALRDIDVAVPGGRAGHRFVPVDRAGCYAPGGRYPLPSSVLMTAIPARVAGVREVWLAMPRPTHVMLAAAAIADVDGVIAVGGAHAIAALALGVGGVARCDVVVGPGNRWVTAAKYIVSATTGIDMLAGPSELVVIADDSANAAIVAADLLAQAEHDADALPILIATDERFVSAVEVELTRQLTTLPTSAMAREALSGGFACVVASIDEAIALSDNLAAEHIEVQTRDAAAVASRLRHYGGLFVGARAAEVLGDYGIGPNHTLPTGGTARFRGGLSVLSFMKCATWLRIDNPDAARETVIDAVALAQLEQLEAHARSAELRL